MRFEPVVHPESGELHWVANPTGWREDALCGLALPAFGQTDEEGVSLDPAWDTEVVWPHGADRWCMPCAREVWRRGKNRRGNREGER